MAKYIVDPKVLNKEKPKKERKKAENPIEKKEKQVKKASKFSENYEENLIRQLFEEKKKKIEATDTSILQEQQDTI
jgi:hypothetical protein